MKVFVRNLLMFALVLVVAAPLAAQDKQKKKHPRHPRRGGHQMFQQLKKLDLTEEQTAKIKEVRKALGPKFADARKKLSAVFTDEMRKARREAFKKAKEEGKKGKELMEAARAATGDLTDEQKATLKEVRAEMKQLHGEAMKAIGEILTDEQKAKLKKSHPKKRGQKKDDA